MSLRSLPFRLRRLPALALWCLGVLLAVDPVAAAEPTQTFDVPAGAAEPALKLFSQQSGRGVIFSTDRLAAVKTNAVRGAFTAREALDRLVAGTGLVVTADPGTGAFALSSPPRPNETRAAPAAKNDPLLPLPAPDAAETVTLSAFQVNADADVGYQAANTTSGSRLNTSLRDTAASITPLTKEFLDDIGAQGLDALVAHTNMEGEFADNAGFNDPAGSQADTTNRPFRLRGQVGGVSVNIGNSGTPVDFSDIDRVEVSSGPNSVLFGQGAVGGLVSLSTKRALLGRDANTARLLLGTYSNRRAELDLNRVLAKQKLAVRFWGLWEDREGWRVWDFQQQHRLNGSVTYRPFKSTLLSASYGGGHLERHVTRPWNAGDQISLWRSLGAQRSDAAAPVVATTGLASYGANQRFTFYTNTGDFHNLRNELTTRGLADNSENNKKLLTPDLMPYKYSFTGPGARFVSDFRDLVVRVEQRLGPDTQLEAVFLRNGVRNTSANFTLAANMAELAADPNLTTPTLAGGTVANPYVGRLYLETNWIPEEFDAVNETARLTATREFRLGKWFGRHRLAGLLEHARQDRLRVTRREIVVDDTGAPVGNPSPENANNYLWRRHYATEGDFSSYHFGDYNVPFDPRPVGGRTYSSRLVQAGTNQTEAATKTWMVATQSFFFKDRLVLTYGYRRDDIARDDYTQARLAANDPRVLARERLAGEFANVFDATRRESGNTRTLGGVLHVTNRVSLFFNDSSNFGNTRFGSTVIPRIVPPPARGQGRDFGLMLDPLGDNRVFLRLTRFESSQIGDAALTPSGTPGDHYVSQSVIRVFNYLEAGGLVARAVADAERGKSQFTSFTIDTASRGYEAEVVANLSKQWTARFAYSYTDRGRENYFAEREPYLSGWLALWRARNDGGVLANGRTIEQEIASLLEDIADNTAASAGNATGSRPRKANVTTRYAFASGRLKGAFVGGTFSWTAKPIQPTPAGQPDIFSDWRQTSLFAGYNFRLRGGKDRWRVQLNVNNVFDSDLADPGRWNTSGTALRRIYLLPPRDVRLTTTVEF